MKTNEELNALKEEVETLNKRLAELTEDELEQITGGMKLVPNSDRIPINTETEHIVCSSGLEPYSDRMQA